MNFCLRNVLIILAKALLCSALITRYNMGIESRIKEKCGYIILQRGAAVVDVPFGYSDLSVLNISEPYSLMDSTITVSVPECAIKTCIERKDINISICTKFGFLTDTEARRTKLGHLIALGFKQRPLDNYTLLSVDCGCKQGRVKCNETGCERMRLVRDNCGILFKAVGCNECKTQGMNLKETTYNGSQYPVPFTGVKSMIVRDGCLLTAKVKRSDSLIPATEEVFRAGHYDDFSFESCPNCTTEITSCKCDWKQVHLKYTNALSDSSLHQNTPDCRPVLASLWISLGFIFILLFAKIFAIFLIKTGKVNVLQFLIQWYTGSYVIPVHNDWDNTSQDAREISKENQGSFGHVEIKAIKRISVYKTMELFGSGREGAVRLWNEFRINREVSSENVVRYENVWLEGTTLLEFEKIRKLKKVPSPPIMESSWMPSTLNRKGSYGFFCIQMEPCLYNLHQALKQPELPNLLKVVTDVALGLTAIHEKNIIHRDIKENNILFGSGNWKIGDFGLSCYQDKIDYWNGCKFYASPEILLYHSPIQGNAGYTTATDLYSFGKVMDNCLAYIHEDSRVFEGLRVIADSLLNFQPDQRISASEILKQVEIFTKNCEIGAEGNINQIKNCK